MKLSDCVHSLGSFSLLSRKEDSEKLVATTPDEQNQTMVEDNSDVHSRYSKRYM